METYVIVFGAGHIEEFKKVKAIAKNFVLDPYPDIWTRIETNIPHNKGACATFYKRSNMGGKICMLGYNPTCRGYVHALDWYGHLEINNFIDLRTGPCTEALARWAAEFTNFKPAKMPIGSHFSKPVPLP